jgi:hypothetical protein
VQFAISIDVPNFCYVLALSPSKILGSSFPMRYGWFKNLLDDQ